MADTNENIEMMPIDMNFDDIGCLIYTIRGRQVMLDYDLAVIYGYEVRRMNEQVKRNISRFPDDFMFRLTKEEIDFVKSQFATSRNTNFFSGQEGGRRKAPLAFSEQGIYMLATVLKGERAERQSIFIMRAFREMRHYIQQNQQFITKNELKMLADSFDEETQALYARQNIIESQMGEIKESINKINGNFLLEAEVKNYVIYKGQKFEADKAYIDIYRKAKNSIYIIDNYVNIKTLEHLTQKRAGVNVILFTENKRGSDGFLTSSQVADFNSEFPTIIVKSNPDCHDRFIVIDYGTSMEKLYSCGASSKDAGKKVCAINKIENTALIHPVIDTLMLIPDKIL